MAIEGKNHLLRTVHSLSSFLMFKFSKKNHHLYPIKKPMPLSAESKQLINSICIPLKKR